jgi:hypothetical protein
VSALSRSRSTHIDAPSPTPPPPPHTNTPRVPPANLLTPLKEACQEEADVALVMHIKAKGDDGDAAIDAMLEAAKGEVRGSWAT